MTAEDDAEVFQELAAQLENEGSLSSPLPSDDVFPDIDPNVVPADVRAALEAILLVASDPVPPTVLAQLLEVGVETVDALCEYLTDSYAQEERGFTINRVAGGYRYQTSDAQAPYVERFVLEGRATRLSTAALETLAIVAYKQPISRAQIASIRGVNVDSVARTLQQRGYIEEVGRDPGPGNATMYGTTTLFLERLGLDTVQDLPKLSDFVPEAEVVETLEVALRGVDETAEPSGTSDLSPPT
ncbi:MAG: SMC-Scp complex subunit ScpB [Actinomycetota bacterium]|nr:SMC-Scp complex subunit ScpB [Acidimicrobiaceae bacterium]MCH2625471.1 SMC-Scp complex subunit ScpB [Acidimicrobiales bacterium]MEC9271126.1 SMC-Scp complex subunit ScpB [Actinomycetota bacterium]